MIRKSLSKVASILKPTDFSEFSSLKKIVFVLPYCWFSHDVTKIQTKKLSILPRSYFHDALEQLKTNFHTNFRFKRVLGFVIEDA